MASELIAAIKGTKEGIGLLSEVIKIAKGLKEDGKNKDLRTLLDQLNVSAKETTRTLEFAVRDIRDMLIDLKLPLDKSLSQIVSNTSWYKWPTKFRLSRINKSVRGLEDQIHTIMGDVSALLICSGQMEGVGEAYSEGFKRGQEILESAPLNMPIAKLLGHFDKLIKDLGSQANDL